MKVKTFILTFLMMMSSPFLFGQHWTDPDLGSDNGMPITATIHLDGSQQTSSYQVAAFYKSTLLEVQTITAIEIPENYGGGSLYHVDMNIPNFDAGESMNGIYFKFFDGTNEYVSVEKVNYDEDGLGIHTDPYEINFKTVAQIEGTGFDVVYPSLQEAIDAAANGDVVTLLKNNAEDVTVVQAPDVAFTIDGAEKTMSGTITVNGKSQAYATAGLTIKNVNFDATNISKDASINLGDGKTTTRYTNGVTVENCDFTGDWLTTGEEKGAIKNYTGGCKNLKINNCTASSLHSLAQLKGVENLAVSGVTVSDCKNGVSVGTSTNVAISDSNITATGYGVRADGEGAYTMTLEDNTISAELPVVVRKAKEVAYKLTIAGNNNNFTAKQQGNNPEGYQVVFTTGDDGTYLAPTTGQFVLSVPENFNVYPVYVAQVGNLKYTSVDTAIAAAQAGETVTILAGNYELTLNINKAITVEGERNDQGENLVNIKGKLNITADGATAKNLNVNNGNGNGAYINAKDVTVDGCKVVGGNGFRNCYTKGLVTFKNSTITGSTYGIHFDGSAGGEIEIDNCVITGWTSFASTITKVTMKGTSFEEGNYNYVRFYQDEVVIEGCIFNENMAIDIAVNGNTTTITNCTFENGNIEDLFADIDIVNSTIIVDGTTLKREASIGNTYYETLAEAFAAAQNGDEVKILAAGTYALSTSGKNIIITGAVDGVVFDNIGAKNMGGANVTFNKVTFDYYPNVNYTGLQHSGNLVYNDCTFEGQPFLYGTSETFNKCTFNQNSADAYNVWTYGAAQVAFNECTFNSAGKSVLIYAEGANIFNDVTVTGCTFNASEAVEGKAAIEMDSSKTAGINLTIDGETTATGFGSGNVSGNSLWNNKKGNNDMANNDITVVVNNVTVLKPWAPVAKIGETPYETLAKAISAATAGQTITICSDVNENVTINKNLTIEGGDNNYTGTMTGNAGLTVTVQNLNFVNAGFAKNTKSTTGTYTFNNCTFDGAAKTYAYPLMFKGANKIIVENCTVKDYLYSFLYVTSSTATVNIKDVTVKDCPSYGVYFSSGVTNTSIENLTVENSNNGFVINNTANRALTLKDCKFENVITAINHTNGTNTVTCNLLGEDNDFGTSALSDYATIVLKEANATLTAKEGLNVTTSVVNSLVKYENEKYVVKPAVAKIGEKYYETLTEAINAADDGATIQLLPVTINEYVAPWITDTQHTSEKSITILGSKDDEGKLATTLTAGMYLGYEDGQCREHTIDVKDVKFEGKGLKVACQQKVTIEGNQFNDITEGQAIAVVGKNIESVVKDNVIDNVAAAQGIELRNTLTATVEGNIISNTGHNALQITSQVDATASEIDVINNTMSNWGKGGEGRAMRINDIVTANINGNVMSHTAAPEEFVKVTGSTTLDASENYWNGVSPLTDGMFTGVEGDLVPVLKSYYTDAEKQNLVVLSPSVAKIGEEYYPSLAAAINAAQANDVIVLLKDITENVTVDKNLTIDGRAEGATANSKYTGKMTVNTSLNINIRNIDFDKGYIDELDGAHGYFTIVNCNFDGVDNSIAYAVTVRGGDKLTIENSTAKNYSTGMLYIPSAVANIDIKDVEVSNVAAAFNISYSGDGTFENVEVNDVTYGLHVQNYGARTFTLNDCVMNNVDFPTYIQKTSTAIVTFKFNNVLGYKETINSGSNQANYGNYVLTSTAAKLTKVADDFNVTVSDDLADNGYVVEYNEGVYSVVAGNVLNSTTGKKYATIQDAIDAAQDNNKIVVLKDVDLSTNECVLLDNSHNTYFKVEGKTVTIDLNGKTISGEYASSPMLVGLFSTDNNGHLTLEDSSDEKTGAVNVTTAEGYTVYSLIANYEPGCSITINGGTYTLDKASDSHIYSGSTNGETEGVTVNGGVFKLGNVGSGDNGKPWMFNVLGANNGNVVVKGGTFDADINHQFWAHEVYVPETLALKDNGDDTWTVVESVAYVGETATSTGSTERKVGYATIEDAIEAIGIRNTNKTVTMLEDVVLENTITIAAGKEVILDLNGKTISGVCNSGEGHMFMVQNTADLTVKDSSENKNGKITYARGTSNTGWVIDLEGDLILESGTIELTGDSWSIGYAVDVRPNSWGSEYTEATTFTMKGGKLVSSDAAVRVASSSADNHENVSANFIMNGGEIEAAWDGIFVQQSNDAYDILNVRINGGNIKSAFSPLRLYGPAATSVLNNVENPITLNITGGTFDYTGNDLENEKWLVRGVIMVSGGATFEQMLEYTDFEITGGTFDGDVNAYCAEGFAAVNNGDGTWTVKPAQEQKLVKGWNWYSSYLNVTITDLTTALGANAIQIKGQTQSEGYMNYDPDWNSWTGPMTTIDFAKMYMINTTEACEMKLAAELLNPEDYMIVVNPGWSWIGYPSNQGVSVSVAFENLTPKAKEGDIIKTRNSGHAEFAWGMWVGTLKTMVPGEGYMYRNTDGTAKEFYYNIDTDSRDVAEANITAENNYWTPNVAEYPFNMTITAVLDGEMMNDNYEIAAFVNGEVRGSARPIYIEPLDAYMFFLTIHGNDVEEMTFKCYDLTSGEEYMLDNRMNYSNDAIVGSVNKPYVFSRGTMGVGEASLSEINIYPNPTTTGREINLQATCDKVEVFNALGVMVAEYQNVDSIDAFETAGIYVIRLTNNGDVKHCKLTVR